jgi:hypothetical protein
MTEFCNEGTERVNVFAILKMPMKKLTLCVLLLVIGLYLYQDTPARPSIKDEIIQNNTLRPTPLGLSFPPVSSIEQLEFTKSALEDLQINRLRFAEDWTRRARTPDTFSWEPLDTRMQWAEDNKLEVFLTIQSNGPEWQCAAKNDKSCVFSDTIAFKKYVEALLQRYPNQIEKIQFGNEWQTTHWYAGTAEQFVIAANIVYDAVQQHSSRTVVVLGGFTTSSLRFLSACSGKTDKILMDDGTYITGKDITSVCASDTYKQGLRRIETVLEYTKYDEVDIHLYDDPEQWPAYHQVITTLTDKPILVSEFGGPHSLSEPTNATYQADRLQEYLTTLDALNITEAYYFKLIEGTNNPIHQNSGLYTPKLEKKPSYDVLRQYSIAN